MRVAVAGPPNSGTHMMEDILKGCGADIADVRHADKAEHFGGYDYAVVMVRGIARWGQSAKNSGRFSPDGIKGPHWLGARTRRDAHQRSYAAFFEALLRFGTPFTVISYESVITDPDDTITTLCSWMGLTFPGWDALPKERPYNRGQLKPFDANAKYRKTLALTE